MTETRGNIFDMPTAHNNTEAICVTTNAMIRNDGRAVMGAGVAKAFRDRYADLDKKLAAHLQKNGNVPGVLANDNNCYIVSFPTKNDWRNDSSIDLIIESAEKLVKIADDLNLAKVWLPRPGCANGHLNWPDVKKELETRLDDRFIIVTL